MRKYNKYKESITKQIPAQEINKIDDNVVHWSSKKAAMNTRAVAQTRRKKNETSEKTIECAKENAIRSEVKEQWFTDEREELLPSLGYPSSADLIIVPPKGDLHPKAAEFLAFQQEDVLISVVCNPKNPTRDKEILEKRNWNRDALWMVDLFPQTPHTECIDRFI